MKTTIGSLPVGALFLAWGSICRIRSKGPTHCSVHFIGRADHDDDRRVIVQTIDDGREQLPLDTVIGDCVRFDPCPLS